MKYMILLMSKDGTECTFAARDSLPSDAEIRLWKEVEYLVCIYALIA